MCGVGGVINLKKSREMKYLSSKSILRFFFFTGESTPPEHILDGDDVPLVEEVLGDMVGTDEVQNAISNGTGVTGENFLDTVMKMNKHNNINSGGDDESEISEFEQKVREKLGLELSPNKSSSSTKKKSNSKKRKIENGLGQVSN